MNNEQKDLICITDRFNFYMKKAWNNNYIEFLCFLNRMRIGRYIEVNGMFLQIPSEWIDKFKLNVQESKYFKIEELSKTINDMGIYRVFDYIRITRL